MAYVVIGDVVESRRFMDQTALLDGLGEVLDLVNARVPASPPLQLIVRDEFHGSYDHAHQAMEAALRLRLATDDLVLATVDGEDEPVDVRVGIGRGDVASAAGGSPTGRARRHAKDARREAEELPAKTRWPPSLRTVVHDDDALDACRINAYLLLQDQLLARMDARDRRALRGLLDGERQVDIAADLGVTQPAIARRVRDRGALAIAAALAQWRDAELAAAGPSTVADHAPADARSHRRTPSSTPIHAPATTKDVR